MGRPRKQTISDDKQQVISSLLSAYEIESVEDIQEALKDLLGGTIKSMLEVELEDQLEEGRARSGGNSRNGYKPKTLKSSYGEIPIDVPRDRKSEFEPKVIPKYERDISAIEGKVLNMYARGMTTRQICEQIEEIYGFEVSAGMVSKITDKILPEIEEWKSRPLSEIYPIVYIDAIYFFVRESNVTVKKAVYVILGVNDEGRKEVMSIQIGETESAKQWLGMFNDLKNRGVKDIFVLCADGLSGIREAIEAAFPQTEFQRCIVHMVRNTLKYVSYKHRKEFAQDLRSIYHAPDEQTAYARMLEVQEKWDKVYPGAMQRWEENWASITPMFKFSQEVRKVIYTTNAIESLNSSYRRLNRQHNVFPGDTALMKAMYLATQQITKKWTMPLRNWGQIYAEMRVMYSGRLP